MKKLLIRKYIMVNPHKYIHPTTEGFWETNGGGTTFTETPYTDGNGTYIGLLDSDTIPSVPFDFNIQEKTEAQINDLLLTWYGADAQGNPYVEYVEGTFVDNRPDPEEI